MAQGTTLQVASQPLTLKQAVGQKLMLTFRGKRRLPNGLRELLAEAQPAGFVLFKALNVESPEQVRKLTIELQEAGRQAGLPHFLIATDQEMGQLMAIDNGTTPFPGSMALGAADSEDLAYRVGYATGCELSAMGVNMNFAPVCDVNSNPRNPVVGTRSFGDNPGRVAALAAAQVCGLQAAGIAATAKHFPGHGDVAQDSHYGVPILAHDLAQIEQQDLPPFQAAIEAGVRLVLTAHLAVPALDGFSDRPATFSPVVLRDLLRGRLGFEGVTISDAMDMGAVRQGDGLAVDVLAAASAGMDLLLLNLSRSQQNKAQTALLQAYSRRLLDEQEAFASAGRVLALKHWLAEQPQHSFEVVGCRQHQELALEAARRALTLVHNHNDFLPLHLSDRDRLVVVVPRPQNLTPADTSSSVRVALASELRKFHTQVEEYVVSIDPSRAEIAALWERVHGCAALVIGSMNALQFPNQQELIKTLLQTGIPTVVAALRLPYDAALFPAASATVCTYSILDCSMQALAEALFGFAPWPGRLPVNVSDI